MLIGSFVCFGVLLLAWLVMPVKSVEAETPRLRATMMVSNEQPV